jgi:hypothetical protein
MGPVGSDAIKQLTELESSEKYCVVCEVQLKHATSAYMYPCNLYLCSRHGQSHTTMRIVNEFIDEKPDATADELSKFIIQSIQQRKAYFNKKNQTKHAHALKMSKLKRSSNNKR